jgi:signal transduction histidine kinase
MIRILHSLGTSYRLHHERQPLLEWIGIVGALAFPVLYLLRQTSIVPPRYDDLWLRVGATLLCIGLALRRKWPARLQPLYLGYSYFVVFYCLSFLLTYTSLKNQGGTLSMMNMVIGVVLIILLTDWRNAVVLLANGYACAIGLYLLTDPSSQVPDDILFAAITSILMLVAGALAHLGQKRAELERMQRLYAGLAGSIAHELRTPLAQVQHALRCIDSEVPAGSAAARAVQQGHSAIHRGLQSISITLQQISQRNPAPAELGTLSAEQCVRKALDEYAYDSPQARDCVRLEVEQDFQFRGHATALELVLFNLLQNSLYYLPLHPRLEVRVAVKATPSPRIVVRDTGPGIAPEQVPRLFEEFHTDGKAGGTGLGLTFCRRTLREWGGDIECRSEQGRFTEFTLSFMPAPAWAPAPPSPVAGAAPRNPMAGRTVLIVDDQRFNRIVGRALMSDLGLNVLEAEHGQQALDMLQQGTLPDVVLMDVNMPGLDGMTTVRLLRDMHGAAARVPVFALTANGSPSVQAAARDAGMQGVLAKPIDIEALKRALATAL